MATFTELAQGYAKRIKEAIKQDGFATYRSITNHDLANSSTIQVAKTIKREIDNLVYSKDSKALSHEDKLIIKRQINEELGLPTLKKDKFIIESANNDDLSDLADIIENILKGK